MNSTFDRRAHDDTGGARVIVIDDDYAMGLSCRKILEKTGYAVQVFEDGLKGLDAVLAQRPDVVVVDLKMPGISGMEIIERVHTADPDMVMVVITGFATIGTAVEAIKVGAFDFIPKPFTPDELRLVVRRALGQRRLLLESHRLEMEREMLKRRFVTFVSHQLKSPLVAIRQYMDVLLRLEGTVGAAEQRKEWLARSSQRCDQLVSLIEDWLTLSRAESSELVQRRDPIDLSKALADVVEASKVNADGRHVSLALTLPDRELVIQGDAGCVNVVFSNLVDNAINYNRPEGSVSVVARVEGEEVCVAVKDTGHGIPEAFRSLVFEEFFRVGDHGAQTPPGTGLGLPITRKIVAEMGGKVELESEVGVGSTFTVRLPLASATGTGPAAPRQEEAPK
ncbi:MAG: hybrid sensor histidine kinase/response regulator [Longimicrobiales bacterium]